MLLGIVFFGLTLQGCESNRHMVLAATGTNIGVEISQNPATQSPQAKLGYQRVELAIVPTNRSSQDTASTSNSLQNGAKDLADVVMELRYGGIFDTGASSGIYQRLAVGTTAVSQPGASLMFAKDADGKVTADAAQALKSLESIKARDVNVTIKTKQLADLRRKSVTADQAKIDGLVVGLGYKDWDNFIDGKPAHPTEAQLDSLIANLKAQGIQ
jgi:hypothetical protein